MQSNDIHICALGTYLDLQCFDFSLYIEFENKFIFIVS